MFDFDVQCRVPGLVDPIKHGFLPEFEALLKRAGFRDGKFFVHYSRHIKGTHHTRGLRVLSPENERVIVTWQPGDNSTRIKLSIQPPPDVPAYKLHNRLKNVFTAVEEELRVIPTPPQEVVEEVSPPAWEGATILPDITQALAGDGTAPPEVGVVRRTEGQKQKFVDNHEQVELFLATIGESATAEGRVKTAECSRVLTQKFGCPKSGPILRSLRLKGYLENPGPGDGWERISPQHWSSGQEVSAPSSEAQPPTVPKQVSEVATSTPEQPVLADGGLILERYVALQRVVAQRP